MAILGTVGKIATKTGGWLLNRTLGRLMGSGISTDSRIVNARAKWSDRSASVDWRVKLTLPTQAQELYNTFFLGNELLKPLEPLRGIHWPLTPAMIVQHSAQYNPMSMTHSNYPHQAYQSSQVDQLNIIGEFPVQNSDDAKHWVATVNFLRGITKMFFGKDDPYGLKGNPPPILHLSGYGDHMFNKVPVIVNTFNVELRSGIDYISTHQSAVYKPKPKTGGADAWQQYFDNQDIDPTWAPTLSTISATVTPIYSRDAVKEFSMKEFVQGKLNGKGKDKIGYI